MRPPVAPLQQVAPALLQQPSSAMQTVAELSAFFAGVGMMLLVMAFEAGH